MESTKMKATGNWGIFLIRIFCSGKTSPRWRWHLLVTALTKGHGRRMLSLLVASSHKLWLQHPFTVTKTCFFGFPTWAYDQHLSMSPSATGGNCWEIQPWAEQLVYSQPLQYKIEPLLGYPEPLLMYTVILSVHLVRELWLINSQ